ncbi:sigma-70 family RNA polymerase sigma factor [Streptomyces albus subsp. chlorinus]|uniref:sigma-70 family RNA polymerase sigma factor n=1 Tax=Streptomyces albus TaxID=1888 RepID=UPI001570DA2E|nr:sigma-70 family RNA polymerase sigma factor [Streptomyces albus]NSC25134.1 sigma-70 family RNA polymerase sigma factor [Streptomyces albus subsp. chlorinus]
MADSPRTADAPAGRTPGTAEELLEQAKPYRNELLAHCYRMMGSVHDAEDLVQDTYLRAWRSGDRFEGRSSLRTWLYRIATNACLTAIEQRGRRPMPSGLGAPSDDPERPVTQAPEVPWLEPIPDAMFSGASAPSDPASVVVDRSSMRLALVAALQHLPARQRAVLLLRDVLKWRAAEVAELLDTTTASVNSALQRARAQLERVAPVEEELAEPTDPASRELLDRYAAAFERSDVTAIIDLFKEDAVWEMPPFEQWFRGREDIVRLIGAQCPIGRDEGLMLPASANGQPAFGLYNLREDGTYRPFHLQVLTLRDGQVAHVGAFFGDALFEKFGLPVVVGAEEAAARR